LVEREFRYAQVSLVDTKFRKLAYHPRRNVLPGRSSSRRVCACAAIAPSP